MPTVDASVMRSANKRAVLGHLYHHKITSRVDVARATGLNRATVSSLVDELIQEKFVEEVGPGISSGGRKPIILQFNANAGYVIGVDVQITHLHTVLINANRDVIYQHRRDMSQSSQALDRDTLTRVIGFEIEKAKQVCPPSPHGLMGIGVGLPGLVNHRQGRALYLPNLGIVDWDVTSALANIIPLPIFVDNDANCGAWSEYLSTGHTNLLFLNVGVGLGAGLVLNGQLYRGASGIAGEAGHHAIASKGDDCHCGNLGCWEQFASERALARSLAQAGVSLSFPLPADFIHAALPLASDPRYVQSFDALGKNLARGLTNLVNLFNPDAVYLGGTVAEATPILLPTIQDHIRQHALIGNQHIPIKPSEPTSVALGAAGLALAQSIDWLPAVL